MNDVWFQNNYVAHDWHRNYRWPMLNMFFYYVWGLYKKSSAMSELDSNKTF